MSGRDRQSILLVDSDPSNQIAVKRALKGLDVDVVLKDSYDHILELVQENDFFLILFGVDSSSGAPFQVAVDLNNGKGKAYVPIIFQAGPEDHDKLLAQGYGAGGVDFLVKPVDPSALLAKVKVFLELDSRQRLLVEATGKIQEQNQKLEERAIRDGLTSLYNHNYLLEQLGREVSLARRYGSSLSVFLLDLDFFKDVNDSCGHPFGDFVLKEFANRVKGNLRESDIFGRYGGEEFLIVLPNTDDSQAEVVAEKIRENVAATVFDNKRYSRYVTVSIGIYSGFGQKLFAPGRIIDCVDSALYRAKAEGRNRVVHYKVLNGDQRSPGDFFSEMVDSSRQNRLMATIEKTRAMTLASFEAMVHAENRDYDLLAERNVVFRKVLDLLANKLKLSDRMIQSFRRAIKLHDLFRCYIQDSSLETEGALTQEQAKMLSEQPVMLKELTMLFDFFSFERVMLSSHHEHFDGTGYPAGLKGDEIPMSARIFMLLDAFVAMLLPGLGKGARDVEEAVEELRKHSGGQFDPFLVETLMAALRDDDSPLRELVKKDEVSK
ncbi:MAG: diguanylate cyclase [Thermodesulfobacteriota bacterium]